MKCLLMVLTFVLLVASLSACDDADSFFFEQLTGVNPIAFAKSTDPAVRAVSQSRPAVKKEQEARDLLQKGLQTKDPDLIAKAIEQRPTNPTYYAYRMAMLAALGRTQGGFDSEFWNSLRELSGVVIRNAGKDGPGAETDSLVFGFTLPAALETRNLFSPGSEEWQRLQRLACAVRLQLEKSSSSLAMATLLANPVGDCPPPKR